MVAHFDLGTFIRHRSWTKHEHVRGGEGVGWARRGQRVPRTVLLLSRMRKGGKEEIRW
jgi:hypothetical protein